MRPARDFSITQRLAVGFTLIFVVIAMALHGHEVRVAHDAPEGLRAAREFSPDVLLCDIGLPSMGEGRGEGGR